MADLIYSGLQSLDGYIADAAGNFDFAFPDEEVHSFVNELTRPIGTYLYGRRMFEIMRFWQTVDDDPEQSPIMLDFAEIWTSADKVVYSTGLDQPSEPRTRIERIFDPEALRSLKRESPADLSIGGAGIAAHAIRAGLVDEFHLFLFPVVVGGGTAFLPSGVRLDLDLVEQKTFGSGVVFLRYHAR